MALHAVCDGDDSMLVLGEGQANRYVPLAEIGTSITPVPPYMEHYLRLIGE